MKTIVTHIGPDLDAITSVWLVKTFLPGWEEAEIVFIPAGTTLKKLPPDENPDIYHVDTGFGALDHHQSDEFTCAARKVYTLVEKEHGVDEALRRLTDVVNDFDHFRDAFYPDCDRDYWEFSLPYVIDGWRLVYPDNDHKTVELGFACLDSVYKRFQNKIWAEKELVKGTEFVSKWGKAIAMETVNDDSVRLAQKSGYVLAIRKDPKKGYIRIKTLPRDDIDLTPYYEALKQKDPTATWFLHASRHMLLNGSTKNPEMRPTTLSLTEILQTLEAPKVKSQNTNNAQ